jgi:hypothetical protein
MRQQPSASSALCMSARRSWRTSSRLRLWVGEGALHHPAHSAEPRSVLGLAASDDWCDPEPAQLLAVAVRVVAAITDHARWLLSRSADSAGHRRDGRDEGEQLLDVVAVRAGQAPGERDPAGVDEKVVLGAGTASVDRARARLGAPFLAWI